jgi:hypothetical protein
VKDVTARHLKFRLFVSTNRRKIYARINQLRFYIDLPERMESGQNVNIPAQATTINFAKKFVGTTNNPLPVIGIALQSAQQGDWYILSNVTLTGFIIEIKNGSTTVSRNIDWMAKGF